MSTEYNTYSEAKVNCCPIKSYLIGNLTFPKHPQTSLGTIENISIFWYSKRHLIF